MRGGKEGEEGQAEALSFNKLAVVIVVVLEFREAVCNKGSRSAPKRIRCR